MFGNKVWLTKHKILRNYNGNDTTCLTKLNEHNIAAETISKVKEGVIGSLINTHLLQWKPFGGSMSNSDSRVEMSTRDVTNRVNQNHNSEAPNN